MPGFLKTAAARRKAGLAGTLLLAAAWNSASAGAWLPLRTHNPFLQVFGAPVAEDARIRQPGESLWRFSFDIANHADIYEVGGEEVEIDGESYYLTAGFRTGLGKRVEFGIDVPLVAHDEGFLDGPIENWHDLLGLSNSRRTGPRNELRFRYTPASGDAFDIGASARGIGDIRLSIGLPLLQTPGSRQLSLRGGVKLPTGDADKLLGSGAADYSLTLYYDDAFPIATTSLRLSAHAGLILPGDSSTLPVPQRDVVGYAGAAIAWRATARLSLTGQVTVQSEYYESALDGIGDESVQLAVGGAFSSRDGAFALTFGIVEDLFANATTDFALHFGFISYRGGAR